MKLENQVCSLKLAKELKKLGVKQKSQWYWCNHKRLWGKKWKLHLKGDGGRFYSIDEEYFCDYVHPVSAFTVAELGELLPIKIKSQHAPIRLAEVICRLKAPVGYQVLCDGHKIVGKIEANARAKMLIYLLENNLT